MAMKNNLYLFHFYNSQTNIISQINILFTTINHTTNSPKIKPLIIKMKALASTITTTPPTKKYSKNNNNNSKRFIISSLFAILFLCILASINEIRYEQFLKISKCAFSNTPSSLSNSSLDSLSNLSLRTIKSSSSSSSPASSSSSSDAGDEELRILVGVLTLPDQYQKRHFLRMIYGTQSPEGARVDLKFVFCNLTKEDQKVLVALEIMRYDDIIILNCKENMNKGKTYTYFSSLPEIFSNDDSNDNNRPNPPYHYVMKTDDDTYFRLDSFVKSLRPLPREDLYYGFVVPCNSKDPFVRYMSGMGYLVSWDLVKWIRDSDIPKAHLEGPEDLVFGDWMRVGHRAKNRFNGKWSMYDYPEPRTGCTHDLWPDTIAVHRLKSQQQWIKTLEYFNVTRDLKPSKLYHIP